MHSNLFIFVIESDDFFYNNHKAVYYNIIYCNYEKKYIAHSKNQYQLKHKIYKLKKKFYLDILQSISISVIWLSIGIPIICFFATIKVGHNNNYNDKPIVAFTAINQHCNQNNNFLQDNNVLLNEKKIKNKINLWAEENISFNINIKTELPMVPINDRFGNPKSESVIAVFKKNASRQGIRLASQSQKNFLNFNLSDPGSLFTTQNAYGLIIPSSRIDLKTNNIYWSIYNDCSVHGAFLNNIFNKHFGFRNTLTLEYFFYNILKKKVKYQNRLLFNYNYIYNKQPSSPAFKIAFPEIVWLFKNNNSTVNFDVNVVPFKNKFSFNLMWTLNDAEETTIKNYNADLLAEEHLTKKKITNLFSFASLNNPNNEEMNQELLPQLLAERIKEQTSDIINKTSATIKKGKQKNKHKQSKKLILLEKNIKKKKVTEKKIFLSAFQESFLTKLINLIRHASHIFVVLIFLNSIIIRQNIVLNLMNSFPIGIRAILVSFFLVGLISIISSLYFWIANFVSNGKPITEQLVETNEQVLSFLDTCNLGARLFIVGILLGILNQLRTLGFGDLPIIRVLIQIIWNFLEKFEKNIFSGVNNNNKKNPPENKEFANSSTPIGGSPTNNLDIITIKNELKIPKPKLPRGIRVVRVVLKKMVRKLKF